MLTVYIYEHLTTKEAIEKSPIVRKRSLLPPEMGEVTAVESSENKEFSLHKLNTERKCVRKVHGTQVVR